MHTCVYLQAPFSADYPGHLQTQLRKSLNAPHLVSLFGQGCAADIDHFDLTNLSRTQSYYFSGRPPFDVATNLAATLFQALPLARSIDCGQLAMRTVTVSSPVKPVTESDYAAALKILEEWDQSDAPPLTKWDAWSKVLQHEYWTEHGGRLRQEIQAIRLDDQTAIVTLPHEIFVELGLSIKAASPFRTTIVISLANDIDFYVPTRRAFEEGGFEPTACPLKPGCGELLVSAAVQLLIELKANVSEEPVKKMVPCSSAKPPHSP